MKKEILDYIQKHYLIKTLRPEHAGWNRDQLFDLVKGNNLLNAAKSIFKWGGINSKNLERFTSSAKRDEKLTSVFNLVRDQGDIDQAFNSMYTGANKLNGIDISFLTKILYFFDESRTGQKALIFDKWSQAWHYAMLDDAGRKCWYSPKLFSDGKVNGNCLIHDALGAYKDYMKQMKDYANACGIKDIGRLEEFLFGKTLKSKKDNPRVWLIDYLSNEIHPESNQQNISNTDFSNMNSIENTKYIRLMARKDKTFLNNDNFAFGYIISVDEKEFILHVSKKNDEYYFQFGCEGTIANCEDVVALINSLDLQCRSCGRSKNNTTSRFHRYWKGPSKEEATNLLYSFVKHCFGEAIYNQILPNNA